MCFSHYTLLELGGASRFHATVDTDARVPLLVKGREDRGEVCLQDEATLDDLVDDVMHSVDVEDEVELADVLEAVVEGLHEDLDEVEDAELALARVHGEDEVQGRVVAVDELGVLAPDAGDAGGRVDKVAGPVGAAGDEGVNLTHQLLLGLLVQVDVELVEPDVALVVDDNDCLDHFAIVI